METYKIELTKKEFKLLLSILKESKEYRAGMGCNDAYPNEQSLFNTKERSNILSELDLEIDDYLSNYDYVQYIINKIKNNGRI